MHEQKGDIQKISEYLEVDSEYFESLGPFNGFIGIDAKLFLDPALLKNTTIAEFSNAREKVIKYYETIITLLKNSNSYSDVAWKEATKRFQFKELKGLSIGYSNKTDNGSAIGPKLGVKLLRRAKEIVDLGVDNPELFEIVGLLEDDFGADRLSDMVIWIIKEHIFDYTQRIIDTVALSFPRIRITLGKKEYNLIKHPVKKNPLLLLPRELLRDLPVATSWDDIDALSHFNMEVRQEMNDLIGSTWKDKVKKKDIAPIILSDKSNVNAILEAYSAGSFEQYDFKKDKASEVTWYDVGKKFAIENPLLIRNTLNNIVDVYNVTHEIIKQFKRNIEYNGLNHHLYVSIDGVNKIRHERYSQLLFYSVADTYAVANNLDLSRESNGGKGPVDFKLSRSYIEKVIVEVKLSSNKKLFQAYEKQIEEYKKSENSKYAIILIIQVTEKRAQIDNLLEFHKERLKKESDLPEIIEVDGRIKPSPSKL